MGKGRNKRERERRAAPAAPAAPVADARPEAAERERTLDLRCIAAVVLLSIVVYANSLGNGLVYDGLVVLRDIKNVRDPFDLKAVFLEPYRLRQPQAEDDDDRPNDRGEPDRAGAYRPLTTWTLAWTYAANEAFGRPGAHGRLHHVVDVLLFAAVSALVFVLARETYRLRRLPALLAAALFAVHPIHTEVVDSVVGRAELLAALFGLLMLRAHARGGRPWACAALYFASLLGKESAAGFLAVAVAQDVLLEPAGTWRQRLRHYGSYALAGVLWWFVLRRAAIGFGDTGMSPSPAANVLFHIDRGTAFLTALRVQLDYLLLQTVPVGLSSDYSFPQIRPVQSIFDLRVLGFLAVLAAAVGLSWRLRTSRPRVALAIVAYAALFAPTSNLVILIGTIMGDRLAFVPSIFFCLLVGEGFDALRERARRWRRVGAVVVLAAFALLTIQRNHTWADPVAFSVACVRDAPDSAPAHYHEGRRLQRARDKEQALFHFRRMYELDPGSGFEAARAFEQLGETDEAVALYRTVLARDPGLVLARKRLVPLLLIRGEVEEARAVVDELGRRSPGSPEHADLKSLVELTTSGNAIIR